MLGFKEFRCAQATLAGIDLIRMLRKGQMRCQAGMSKTPAELFYGLQTPLPLIDIGSAKRAASLGHAAQTA